MAESVAESGRPRWRLRALCAVLIACLFVFARYGVEWVENEVDLGYSEEALRNPYLAAAMFLEEQGIASEMVVGLSLLDDLPEVADTVFLTISRRTLSERRLANLRAWVNSGGHLVVAAEEVFDPEQGKSRDPFLDQLGIYLNRPDDAEPDSEPDSERDSELGSNSDDELAHPHAGETGDEDETDDETPQTLEALLEKSFAGQRPSCLDDRDGLAYMPVSGLPEPLELELFGGNFLSTEYSEGLAAYSAAGAQLVRVPLGSGMVTAATSSDIWLNARIHCHDHAYLLWLLSRPSAKVWLQHDPDLPSLTDLLAGSFPLAGAGFSALFLVWAASRSLRFGPLRILQAGERRELLEHLQATADFGWRGALLRAPLAALREDLLRRLERGRAAGRAPAREDSAARLARITGLETEDVEFALAGDPLLKKRDFVKTMKILSASRRLL